MYFCPFTHKRLGSKVWRRRYGQRDDAGGMHLVGHSDDTMDHCDRRQHGHGQRNIFLFRCFEPRHTARWNHPSERQCLHRDPGGNHPATGRPELPGAGMPVTESTSSQNSDILLRLQRQWIESEHLGG